MDKTLVTRSTGMLLLKLVENEDMYGYQTVSYTHLEVYKRQVNTHTEKTPVRVFQSVKKPQGLIRGRSPLWLYSDLATQGELPCRGKSGPPGGVRQIRKKQMCIRDRYGGAPHNAYIDGIQRGVDDYARKKAVHAHFSLQNGRNLALIHISCNDLEIFC